MFKDYIDETAYTQRVTGKDLAASTASGDPDANQKSTLKDTGLSPPSSNSGILNSSSINRFNVTKNIYQVKNVNQRQYKSFQKPSKFAKGPPRQQDHRSDRNLIDEPLQIDDPQQMFET